MMKRNSVVVAGVGVLLVLTGCSDSGADPEAAATNGGAVSSDPPGVRLRSALQAQERGDYAAACTYLDPEDVKSTEVRSKTTCAEALKKSAEKEKYSEVAVDSSQVRVEGDTAVVPASAIKYKLNGQPTVESEDVRMVRRDGQWFIDHGQPG